MSYSTEEWRTLLASNGIHRQSRNFEKNRARERGMFALPSLSGGRRKNVRNPHGIWLKVVPRETGTDACKIDHAAQREKHSGGGAGVRHPLNVLERGT